jgi:hypothetical protein
VAAILDIVKGVYLPMAQLAQQQGVMLDLNALFEKVGTYSDQPDLIEIIHTMTPPAEPASGGGGGGDAGTGMPQETTRNYVRRSLGNDTQANRDAGLENQLAAAGGNRNGAMNGDGRG